MAIASSTAAAITAAVALASAAVGTVSAVQQAQQQQRQQEFQSKLAERNARQGELNAQAAEEAARQEKRQGYEHAQAKRQEAARIISAQRAEAGASGAQTDAGSALDRILDTAEKGELDALSAQQQGQDAAYQHQLRAWNLRNQAAGALADAAFHRQNAQTDYLGLTSTLLNGASRVGRNFFSIGSQGPRLP